MGKIGGKGTWEGKRGKGDMEKGWWLTIDGTSHTEMLRCVSILSAVLMALHWGNSDL